MFTVFSLIISISKYDWSLGKVCKITHADILLIFGRLTKMF